MEGLLKNIVPGDPWCEMRGDTLVVSGEMSFIHNMRDKGLDILDFLKKDPRFEYITLPETDSKISIFAKLTEPVDGISNVEIYINKDM